PRPLTPFPTRRSSDLDGRLLAYDDAEGIHVVSKAGGHARLLVAGTSTGIAWSPAGDAVAFVGAGGPALVTLGGHVRTVFPVSPPDRKSTRLNSSHQIT